MSSAFIWNKKKRDAAIQLAEGLTQAVVAAAIGVTDRTIRNWLAEIDFASEVDRLTLMLDLSSRAERVRAAKRVLNKMRLSDGTLPTNKDALDWLKFVQSETDGIKLDVAALLDAEASLADQGQARSSETTEGPHRIN